jgi:hypothetical protein
MTKAFFIVRVQHTNIIKPIIKCQEVVLSDHPPAFPSPDPDQNHRWATFSTIHPDNDSKHVTFHVAVEKRGGNYITGREVLWDLDSANIRVAQLAIKELSDVLDMDVDYKFNCEWRRGGHAIASFTLAGGKEVVWFEAIEMEVEK